jgi:MFS family permease
MQVTLVVFAVGIAGFSVSPWLWLGFVFLAVGGLGYLMSNTSATSRLILAVDDSQRGRIMALWSVAFIGLRPLASLADGGIADLFGVRVAGVCLALPCVAGALAILVLERRRKSYSAITQT